MLRNTTFCDSYCSTEINEVLSEGRWRRITSCRLKVNQTIREWRLWHNIPETSEGRDWWPEEEPDQTLPDTPNCGQEVPAWVVSAGQEVWEHGKDRTDWGPAEATPGSCSSNDNILFYLFGFCQLLGEEMKPCFSQNTEKSSPVTAPLPTPPYCCPPTIISSSEFGRMNSAGAEERDAPSLLHQRRLLLLTSRAVH